MTDISQRELPHNYDAEQAVLGCLLIDPTAVYDIMGMLQATDFMNQAHAEIFRGFMDLHEQRVGIDVLNLHNWLQDHGRIEHHPAYLIELINMVPTSVNSEHYADIVRG
ncbi:MAG: replicative DNA helicase, partial [Candidatus Competibacteraceae bacterium]|nr:replicative DNA helicase [Candidatus Competibacteraceae bacterium]